MTGFSIPEALSTGFGRGKDWQATAASQQSTRVPAVGTIGRGTLRALQRAASATGAVASPPSDTVDLSGIASATDVTQLVTAADALYLNPRDKFTLVVLASGEVDLQHRFFLATLGFGEAVGRLWRIASHDMDQAVLWSITGWLSYRLAPRPFRDAAFIASAVTVGCPLLRDGLSLSSGTPPPGSDWWGRVQTWFQTAPLSWVRDLDTYLDEGRKMFEKQEDQQSLAIPLCAATVGLYFIRSTPLDYLFSPLFAPAGSCLGIGTGLIIGNYLTKE